MKSSGRLKAGTTRNYFYTEIKDRSSLMPSSSHSSITAMHQHSPVVAEVTVREVSKQLSQLCHFLRINYIYVTWHSWRQV